ncbi:adenylate/guanylate cyclase domain-containing protein [Spirulina sp. CS-785/01]|uniref:adenylate/guanylate cyclase domain-containing protein n=1 Tax=Spirulina sp. CS-785/01 TaxID=3021716 RepID=UPI00232A99CE|nr:adenylate/guanylate cyclase domain-containing protein [Spirulina sp. CS-785/01]MDB9312924.1 adenylate/guanylate cyclase domain-containing protein [Spirulina sp. CS-785/01]
MSQNLPHQPTRNWGNERSIPGENIEEAETQEGETQEGETQEGETQEGEEVIFADEEDDDDVIFADEDDNIFARDEENNSEKWKILIVDDEAEIHSVTQLALTGFTFEGKPLKFFCAYSGEEAKAIIRDHPDIALILLDVIMETDEAGLDVVRYIRDDLKNVIVRIILRTGQPGQVLEDVVILNYDINDYKTKTELTTQKLFTALVTAIRSYKALCHLEASRQELAQIAAASSRFVPRQFLQLLNKRSIIDVELGDSVQQEMSVLFADIRDFTPLSEQMTPQENFQFINAFLQCMEPAISENQGFIDKYIGDAIMALFPGAAENAVDAGISMITRLVQHNQNSILKQHPHIQIGIGINTGDLMLGTVGGNSRMEGTVISDAVNVASRVENLTKIYGVSLLITEETYLRLKERDRYAVRRIGRVLVKGKSKLVTVHEVFDADPEPLKQKKLAIKEQFQQALTDFDQAEFEQAKAGFKTCLEQCSDDPVAQVYLRQCETGIDHDN